MTAVRLTYFVRNAELLFLKPEYSCRNVGIVYDFSELVLKSVLRHDKLVVNTDGRNLVNNLGVISVVPARLVGEVKNVKHILIKSTKQS